MELYKTSANGNELNVLFMSNYYVFHNTLYGYVAIAERIYNTASRESYINLYVGNKHIGGGSLTENGVITAAKRLITKAEKKYNSAVKVEFMTNIRDCNAALIELNITK